MSENTPAPVEPGDDVEGHVFGQKWFDADGEKQADDVEAHAFGQKWFEGDGETDGGEAPLRQA